MPSLEHQELVDSLARFMKENLKLNLDGVEHDNYPNKSREIMGHRPDVIAYDPENQLWYFGDAKTEDDVSSKNTKDQLTAWSQTKMSDGKSADVPCPIYVAVPKTARDKLVQALKDWGLDKRVRPITYA